MIYLALWHANNFILCCCCCCCWCYQKVTTIMIWCLCNISWKHLHCRCYVTVWGLSPCFAVYWYKFRRETKGWRGNDCALFFFSPTFHSIKCNFKQIKKYVSVFNILELVSPLTESCYEVVQHLTPSTLKIRSCQKTLMSFFNIHIP